jgi:hypothetical protein
VDEAMLRNAVIHQRYIITANTTGCTILSAEVSQRLSFLIMGRKNAHYMRPAPFLHLQIILLRKEGVILFTSP